MTKAQIQDQVLLLPVEDQLELAQEILGAVVPDLEFEVPPRLAAVLEQRRAEAEADPRGGRPETVVHARLRSELARRA